MKNLRLMFVVNILVHDYSSIGNICTVFLYAPKTEKVLNYFNSLLINCSILKFHKIEIYTKSINATFSFCKNGN